MAVRFHDEWICLEYQLSGGTWGTLYKTKRFKNGMRRDFSIIGTGQFRTMGLPKILAEIIEKLTV